MIAQGRSNQEIADGLGISGNTVAYHIKQLFLKPRRPRPRRRRRQDHLRRGRRSCLTPRARSGKASRCSRAPRRPPQLRRRSAREPRDAR
jgi:FixJ family two-component response regulator